jgi:HK97 gp10 family phage protein
MEITVKLEGVDDVKAAFSAKLEEYRAGIEAAVQAGSEAVQADWRAAAARDTGRYADSIEIRNSGLMAEVGNFDPATWYGSFTEHGTSKQPAQPAALPAAEMERARLPERFREVLSG